MDAATTTPLLGQPRDGGVLMQRMVRRRLWLKLTMPGMRGYWHGLASPVPRERAPSA